MNLHKTIHLDLQYDLSSRGDVAEYGSINTSISLVCDLREQSFVNAGC